VNERIRAKEIRVIDSDGTQLGILSVPEALERARVRGLDLVEVAPTANPPVCKIVDYGKYKYEQGKKAREARKKSGGGVKGIRMRPRIDDHDFETKVKSALKFLQGGDKVKFTIMFRGREIGHSDLARLALDKVVEAVKELAQVEKAPAFEGRTLTMILAPKAH
jgi:translation initiation factor IF-3